MKLSKAQNELVFMKEKINTTIQRKSEELASVKSKYFDKTN